MRLQIEKSLYGGSGLARIDGKAVFVPFVLPGETVEVHLTESRRSYSEAELDAILEPSPARTQPPCPYYGTCGGCHYQHATYATQVEIKLAILRETLERARISGIPEISPITAEPLGYRNRVRLHVQRNPFALCYKRRNSHFNLPIGTCPIAMPILQHSIQLLNQQGSSLGLDWATEVELFASPDASSMLLSLWTGRSPRQAKEALAACWPRLRTILPALQGAAVFLSDKPSRNRSSRVRRSPEAVAHEGVDHLLYTSGDLSYKVSIGSFFQVNRFLIDSLVDLVTYSVTDTAVWDLYAGVGLFSLPLTRHFTHVTAVESAPSAVRDLRQNLVAGQHRAVAADTASFLRRAIQQRQPAPELVVVDPPRAGLGSEVTTLLGSLQPRNITYVSCDPATLSRDLAALLESGYRLKKLHLVDLFPQTFHLESVSHLSLD
jgi:23S rRNA (uracil1939-C5)-methyltransferase